MSKNLSPKEFDKLVKHYTEVLDACQKALDETEDTMNNTLDIVEAWLMNEVSNEKKHLTEKMAREVEDVDGEDIF